MTGQEHYERAQLLLGEVIDYAFDDPYRLQLIAKAQVHATLALAAATATAGNPADLRAWLDVAS